jgi:glutathione synthase/RimK-type ligase-like ATP-grasp enzyme
MTILTNKRVALFPYGASEGVKELRDEINSQLGYTEEDTTVSARILLRGGRSRFRGSEGDVIVNWGSRSVLNFNAVTGNGIVINRAECVSNASLKDKTMELLASAGVSHLESTTNKDTVMSWMSSGCGVFARKELNGHSGSGIVFMSSYGEPEYLGSNVEFSESVIDAPLYTKALMDENRKEFRVHVFDGKVILIQQKRRKNGWRDDENYSDVVRNFGNGWIFATSSIDPSYELLKTSIEGVAALGLTFGAIDMMTDDEGKPYIVEINTAPGLDGESTKKAYAKAVVETITNVPVEAMYQYVQPAALVFTGLPEEEEDEGDEITIAYDTMVSDLSIDLATASSSLSIASQMMSDVPSGQEALNLFMDTVLGKDILERIGNNPVAYYLCGDVLDSGIPIKSHCLLIDGFTWSNSPQGHQIWASVNSRSFDSAGYFASIVEADMLLQSTQSEPPLEYVAIPVHQHSDKPWYKQLVELVGAHKAYDLVMTLNVDDIWVDAYDIDSLCTWEDTEQGHDFWQDLYTRSSDLTTTTTITASSGAVSGTSFISSDTSSSGSGASSVSSSSSSGSVSVSTTSELFTIVSSAIGREDAIRELTKVASSIDYDDGARSLFGAFSWSRSPQGAIFWNAVKNGNRPVSLPAASTPPPAPVQSVPVDVDQFVVGSFYKLTLDGTSTMGAYLGEGKFSVIGYDLEIASSSFSAIDLAA